MGLLPEEMLVEQMPLIGKHLGVQQHRLHLEPKQLSVGARQIPQQAKALSLEAVK
jgi:hypothetical protein